MSSVSVMELSLGAWCEYHGAITGCPVLLLKNVCLETSVHLPNKT